MKHKEQSKIVIPQFEDDFEMVFGKNSVRNLAKYQLRPRLETEDFVQHGQKLGVCFRVFWDNISAQVALHGDEDGWLHFSTKESFGTYFSFSWNLEFEFIDSLLQGDMVSVAIDDYFISSRGSGENLCMAYLNVEKGKQMARASQDVALFGGRHVASFLVDDHYALLEKAHSAWVDMVFSGRDIRKVSIKNPIIYSQYSTI